MRVSERHTYTYAIDLERLTRLTTLLHANGSHVAAHLNIHCRIPRAGNPITVLLTSFAIYILTTHSPYLLTTIQTVNHNVGGGVSAQARVSAQTGLCDNSMVFGPNRLKYLANILHVCTFTRYVGKDPCDMLLKLSWENMPVGIGGCGRKSIHIQRL